MRTLFLLLALSISLAPAQIKRERVPNVDDYLKVSMDIGRLAEVRAPQRQVALHGVDDYLQATRTPDAVFAEVQQNEPRLSYLYKTWKFKGVEGVGPRYYGLALIIGASGSVDKVVVQGPTNPDFLKEVQANIKTWVFSKVKDKRPRVVKLHNLDFMYRKELVMN